MTNIIFISVAMGIFLSVGLFMLITKKGALMMLKARELSNNKEKWDVQKLCRFGGIMMLVCAGSLALALVSFLIDIKWLSIVSFTILVLSCILIIFLPNFTKLFRTKKELTTDEDKGDRT